MTSSTDRLTQDLTTFQDQGYLVIENALTSDEVAAVRDGLTTARQRGWQGGINDVGVVWFPTLLDRAPDVFGGLVAHDSVREHLRRLGGAQLQFRSMIGHIYPGPYVQAWHMDHYGAWERPGSIHGVRATAINTTFYLQDHQDDEGALELVASGHRCEPPGLSRDKVRGSEANEFTRWCDAQPRLTLHPKAGDCVLFYSHLPHRGIKYEPRMERSNIVCHYQITPFYDGVWFVTEPRAFEGSFPFGPRGLRLQPARPTRDARVRR